MLKLLVVCALLGFACAKPKMVFLPEGEFVKAKEAIIKCNKGGPQEDPNELISLVSKGWLRQDQHFRDLLFCTYHTNGFVENNGKYNMKNIEAVLGDNKEALDAVKGCNSLKSSPVETTFLNVACFLKQEYHFMFKGQDQ